MAAFLFFLSVALTVTNREDIRSTLLADHKMRAEFAADGVLDYNLQVMRTQPNWEEVLREQTLASGAVVKSTWRTTRPGVVEVTVSANSNLIKAERHWLLEEFRLADSLAVGDKKPHLFAMRKAGDSLTHAVLGPNFRWQSLGAAPPQTLTGTYVAKGGPLYLETQDQGATPPTLQDWQPIIDTLGVVNFGGFGPTSQQLPKGHGASTGKFENEKFSFDVLPDPGDTLGRVKQATINGRSDGQPTFTTVTLAGNLVELDTSEYQGPCVEWYTLSGTVADAKENLYYCHGRHIYMRGVRFRNKAGSDPPGSVDPGGYYDEPCLLSYDPASKAWAKVVDLLKVTDDLSEPVVVDGPRPNQATMWVTQNGQIFTAQSGANNLLRVVGDRFEVAGNLEPNLLVYRDQLLSVAPRSSDGLMCLSSFDPAQYLTKLLPGRNVGARSAIPGANLTMPEEPTQQLHWAIAATPTATAREELYALVTCQARLPDNPNGPPRSTGQALAHFDGKNWQLLPSGLAGVLAGSYFVESQRDYGGKPSVVNDIVALALAGYSSSQPLLRRYSPLVHF